VPTVCCNTMIDEYYDNVVKYINVACKRCIPAKQSTGSNCDHVVPRWNDCVKEKHDLARNAFLEEILEETSSGPLSSQNENHKSTV